MSVVDVSAFIGPYPFRHLEHSGTPEWLLAQMDRLGIDRSWVGYLPAFLYKDPAPGNAALQRLVASYGDRLLPVPVVNTERPRLESGLNSATQAGAPAVRMFPQYEGVEPGGGAMRVAVAAAAALGLPVVLTVRLEDVRQRHPLDVAPELTPSAVRSLVRSDADVRLIVTNAERTFVEETHFGLTPDEATRILWDVAWIWGPPEDHLALLLETVGAERFVLGTGMPLRIPDAAFAKLDLLDASSAVREAVLGGNLERWLDRS